MCVYERERVCVCVCVCMRERKREREGECIDVLLHDADALDALDQHQNLVCVRVCACECICV